MKRLILILFAAILWADDHTVCTSGCTHSTMQAAIDAADPGDTITLTANTTFATAPFELKNKPGAEWITIRSSKSHLLPEGYSPMIGDTRLATLAFTDTSAIITFTADPAFSSDCWTATAVGNVVTFGPLHAVGLTCEARLVNEALYTSNAPVCTITLAGTASPAITAGTAPAWNQGTGLRVGLGNDGICYVNHKSDIVLGTHYTCTNCAVGETSASIKFPEGKLPLGTIAYSTAAAVTGVDGATKTVWLSGPQARKTDMPGLYVGTYAAAYKGLATGIHHYRWEGIHFRYDSTVAAYYGVVFYKAASYDYRYVPHHLEWDRCIFSQPKAGYNYWRWIYLAHGENIWIHDTRFLNSQTVAEAQAIGISGSEGPIIMENVEIDGSTENFLAGGSNQVVVGVPQVIMRRSLMRKRMEQNPSLQVVRQTSTDTLALTAVNGTTRCNAGTCTGYYEDTPYTFAQDSTITLTAGAAAALLIGMSPTGVLTVGHNSGANVTCSGSFTCLAGITSRSQMAEYAMLYDWTGTAGAWAATSSWRVTSSSYIYHKNNFELKIGKNVLLEGNLFRTYWNMFTQQNIAGIGPRNQNGQDVSARIDGVVFTRNKIASAHAGPYFFGLDTLGGNTFMRGVSFTHNILLGINKALWGNYTWGGFGVIYGDGGLTGSVIEHSTFEADQRGIEGYLTVTAKNSLLVRNNLILGSAAGFIVEGQYDGFLCGWSNNWTPHATRGYLGPTSEYRGNLFLNDGTTTNNTCLDGVGYKGWHDPQWTDFSARNYTNNTGASSITFSDHLTSISNPPVHSDNVKIKDTSVYSVHNAGYIGPVTTTGMDAGADTDLVEALTNGVNEGQPEWWRRKSGVVERDGATAAVSLTCPGETATWVVSTHQRMKSTDTGYQTGSAACGSARQAFAITGLTPGTQYWLKVSTATGVWKDRI